jgi:hypothetical protein
MTERLSTLGRAKRARHHYEPQTMLAGIKADAIHEVPLDERTISHQYYLGRRDDGTKQWITVFGGGKHRLDSLFEQTRNAWDGVRTKTSRLDRLTVFVEGRVRNPSIDLTDKQIFEEHSEIGLFEVHARRAGVTDIRNPEPHFNVLMELADEYGYDAVNDYLYERLYRQWRQLPESNRQNFATYAILHIPREYYPELEKRRPYAIGPEGLTIIGTYERLRGRFPDIPQEGALPATDELVDRTLKDTTHAPILQDVPEERRTRIQKVAVAYNYERDVAYVNAIMGAVAEGKDVAIIAHRDHISAMAQPLVRLQKEYLRMRYHKQLLQRPYHGDGK